MCSTDNGSCVPSFKCLPFIVLFAFVGLFAEKSSKNFTKVVSAKRGLRPLILAGNNADYTFFDEKMITALLMEMKVCCNLHKCTSKQIVLKLEKRVKKVPQTSDFPMSLTKIIVNIEIKKKIKFRTFVPLT